MRLLLEPPLDVAEPPRGLRPLVLPPVRVLVEVEVRAPVRGVEAPVARPVLALVDVQVQDEALRVQQAVWGNNERAESVFSRVGNGNRLRSRVFPLVLCAFVRLVRAASAYSGT